MQSIYAVNIDTRILYGFHLILLGLYRLNLIDLT